MLWVRTAIVAVAATAAGTLHQIAEYIAAVVLSDANWDSPPGSGSGIVVLCLLAAVATVALWWTDAHSSPVPAEPATARTGSS